MLQLKAIKKDYKAGDTVVHALKGVDISFRKSEFVSILGPSGCGKTTLLNIIGGLDHYSDGELYIDGVSTKSYTDRDWDTYRNYRIGFVFQSYNLIPHQTISENVELALNISGVDKSERIKLAHEALDKVGLKGQYNKKPNQLSGGQCQRVAIARALVNAPEILLADEPTGALDTTTSVQIMDLIQEISKECLVIMVTHNPELAEKYSTRIIRLLDGEVVDDTNPFDGVTEDTSENKIAQNVSETHGKTDKKEKKHKKAKLSVWSAFRLSAKNLLSKSKRTFLVCLAGSIGIIGVASVLAVSTGTQNYIYSMQNDMLSGNPIAVNAEALDMDSFMSTRSSGMQAEAIKASVEDGYVNADNMIEYLIERSGNMSSFTVTNDITNEYVSYVKSMPEEYYAAIATYYGINLSNNIYTDFMFDGATKSTSVSAANQTYRALFERLVESDETGAFEGFENFAEYFSLFTESFMQAPDNTDFILSQYDILSDPETSKIATEANEIMIVVNDDTALSDLLLAQFGYYSQEELFNIVYKAIEDDNYDESLWKQRFSYEDLMGKTFTWYPNNMVYNIVPDMENLANSQLSYNPYATEDWQGKELKITAILKPKDGISYGCLESGFYYTAALAEEIIADSMQSQIVTFLNRAEMSGVTSISNNGVKQGLTYNFSTWLDGVEDNTNIGIVGSENNLNGIIGSMTGENQPSIYTLTLRELGGVNVPDSIEIYPANFDYKNEVTAYLNEWNSDKDIIVDGITLKAEYRANIVYTDNLELVIGIINNLIDIVTAALVAFTALSLVVSTIMITYYNLCVRNGAR